MIHPDLLPNESSLPYLQRALKGKYYDTGKLGCRKRYKAHVKELVELVVVCWWHRWELVCCFHYIRIPINIRNIRFITLKVDCGFLYVCCVVVASDIPKAHFFAWLTLYLPRWNADGIGDDSDVGKVFRPQSDEAMV